eukprot:300571-Chlamydomonas_euryale.AAC.5
MGCLEGSQRHMGTKGWPRDQDMIKCKRLCIRAGCMGDAWMPIQNEIPQGWGTWASAWMKQRQSHKGIEGPLPIKVGDQGRCRRPPLVSCTRAPTREVVGAARGEKGWAVVSAVASRVAQHAPCLHSSDGAPHPMLPPSREVGRGGPRWTPSNRLCRAPRSRTAQQPRSLGRAGSHREGREGAGGR